MDEMNFDGIGRFIYGAHRYGGDLEDVLIWMANDLAITCPRSGDDDAMLDLYNAFFKKYRDSDALQMNCGHFLASLKNRNASLTPR